MAAHTPPLAAHSGRNPAGTRATEPNAKAPRQVGDDILHGALTIALDGLHQQGRVLRLLDRLEDQRRVGGRVAGLELRKLVKVTGVGDHRGVVFESVELAHGLIIPPMAPAPNSEWDHVT